MPDTKHKKVWREMLQRCYNPTRKDYVYYGKRGIAVCKAWKSSYNAFLDWSTNNGYEEGLTIERKDNNLNYCPENCAWVTRAAQVLNRRTFSNNTSGYTGITFHKKNKTWTANININYKRIHLGSYKLLQDAVEARNSYIIENKLPHKIQEFKIENN